MQARWAEELECHTGIYIRRWYIETKLFSIRLHHWIHSDDNRNLHDHPWWFITFVLSGSYIDINSQGQELMKAPKVAFRYPNHKHTVHVSKGGCWTLLITGPKVRKWGFWVNNKFKKANKYFLEHGMHTCD